MDKAHHPQRHGAHGDDRWIVGEKADDLGRKEDKEHPNQPHQQPAHPVGRIAALLSAFRVLGTQALADQRRGCQSKAKARHEGQRPAIDADLIGRIGHRPQGGQDAGKGHPADAHEKLLQTGRQADVEDALDHGSLGAQAGQL